MLPPSPTRFKAWSGTRLIDLPQVAALDASAQFSGLARTARDPVMSCGPAEAAWVDHLAIPDAENLGFAPRRPPAIGWHPSSATEGASDVRLHR